MEKELDRVSDDRDRLVETSILPRSMVTAVIAEHQLAEVAS